MKRLSLSVITLGVLALALTFAGTARADSSVMGRSDRNHFGRWEWVPLPRLSLGIGTSTHMFAIGDVTPVGSARSSAADKVDIPSNLLRGNTVVAQTFDLRFFRFHVGPLYLGPLVEIGPAFRSGTPNAAGYSSSSSGIFFEGGLLPGAAFDLGQSGVTLRLEMLLGGRIAQFSGSNDAQRAFNASSMSWVAQPRVTLDVWTSPYVTIGAFGGTNLVRQSDYVAGVSLTAHLSPFDAAP